MIITFIFKVHQVQEVQRAIGVSKDQRDRWDKEVKKETKACLGQLEPKEKEVLLDHQARRDKKAHQGHGVFQVLKVQEVLQAVLEVLAKKGTQVSLDFLVRMESQAHQDRRDHRGRGGQQDLWD